MNDSQFGGVNIMTKDGKFIFFDDEKKAQEYLNNLTLDDIHEIDKYILQKANDKGKHLKKFKSSIRFNIKTCKEIMGLLNLYSYLDFSFNGNENKRVNLINIVKNMTEKEFYTYDYHREFLEKHGFINRSRINVDYSNIYQPIRDYEIGALTSNGMAYRNFIIGRFSLLKHYIYILQYYFIFVIGIAGVLSSFLSVIDIYEKVCELISK